MNTLNPTITIQNLEGDHWLVRYQHDFCNGETLDCTVKIAKNNSPISDTSARALRRIAELAEHLAAKTE